jgi:ABC-2 type transport system permease protein
MDLFFYIASLSTVDMIYGHVQHIGEWNRDQFLFFISFMLIIDQLHMVVVSENFWELSEKIRTGQMDFVLLKPLHSIFNSFFRGVRISSMLNAPVVWSFLIYFGIKANLTLLAWIFLPLTILLSFIVLILLEFILSTSMFWTVGGVGINFLRMQMQSVSRWPDYVYSKWPRRILIFLIPILMVGNPAVKFLLNPTQWQHLIGLLTAIVLLSLVLLKLWNKAIKQYDSASS